MSFNVTTLLISNVTSIKSFDVTTTNGSDVDSIRSGRTQIQQILLEVTQKFALFIVVTIMLGVGCSLDLKQMVKYLKRPKEFVTGLCLQLFGMPLIGLTITQILRMNTPEALGVIVQSIVPGGAYSNLVTYWLDGDIDLSVVMTGSSTLLSFGSMSLWLFIISKILKLEQQFLIPYLSIGICALSTTVPLICGIIIRHFIPKTASKITKMFSIIGSICIIIGIVLNGFAGVYDYPIGYKTVLAAVLMISTAVLFGYLASSVPWLSLESSCRRTIAIETVFQSTPVAFSIIVLSFSSADAAFFGQMSFFSTLYILVLMPLTAVVISVYKILKTKEVCMSQDDFSHGAKAVDETGASDTLLHDTVNGGVKQQDIKTCQLYDEV